MVSPFDPPLIAIASPSSAILWTRVNPSGILASKAAKWTVFRPRAGTYAGVGTPNNGPPAVKFSRLETGSGVVPNSRPSATVRLLHGAAAIALFSSQIATHGKSARRKQYAIRRLSRRFTAAIKPTSVLA